MGWSGGRLHPKKAVRSADVGVSTNSMHLYKVLFTPRSSSASCAARAPASDIGRSTAHWPAVNLIFEIIIFSSLTECNTIICVSLNPVSILKQCQVHQFNLQFFQIVFISKLYGVQSIAFSKLSLLR